MQAMKSSCDIVIFGGGAGSGKALDVNTPILTGNGWKAFGSLVAGDVVFGQDGNKTKIINAFQQYETDDVYEITFDNGAKIVADGGHLWETLTEWDRDYLRDSTVEVRERRKLFRPAKLFAEKTWLSERNRETASKFVPQEIKPKVRTTREMLETLHSRRGAKNHTIRTTAPITGDAWPSRIAPYMLGAWLGDGHSSAGYMTISEDGMCIEIEKSGHLLHKLKQKYLYKVPGLTDLLKHHGLINNKHIPDWVLLSDVESRKEVLRGLMDTDGTVSKDGKIEFCVCHKPLAIGFVHLASSLGIKCSMTESDAVLKGVAVNRRFRIGFKATFHVFNLERKQKRQVLEARKTTKHYFITDIQKVSRRLVRCIEVDAPDRMFVVGDNFIPTHNSYMLLMESLYHKNNPGFGAVIFRRTYPEIMNEGGLWDTSEQIFPFVGAVPRQSACEWVFPSGATVKFAHLQHEKDKLSWQGSGIPLIGFDELTHFSEGQFFYLMSRNRLSNDCGIRPYIRATCNPDPDSWVARFIEWWIDQDTGLPIKERSGVPRYFIRENGKIVWGNSRKDFTLPPGQEPKSATFIPALVTDNKALMKNDPAYLSNLHALPYVERERLLNGNWKVRPVAGSFFKRHWFKIIKASEAPTKGRMVRYWDRAATEVSSGSKDPDWTAGVCGILPEKPIEGRKPIIILDVKRERLSPAGVMALVKRAIEEDPECEQWLEEDPGQAGKSEVEMYRRELPDQNIRTLRPKGSKAFRAKPASAACEHGDIWIVEGAWNAAFIAECESFADWDVIEKSERPAKLPHDDQVDALSGLVFVLYRGGTPSVTRA